MRRRRGRRTYRGPAVFRYLVTSRGQRRSANEEPEGDITAAAHARRLSHHNTLAHPRAPRRLNALPRTLKCKVSQASCQPSAAAMLAKRVEQQARIGAMAARTAATEECRSLNQPGLIFFRSAGQEISIHSGRNQAKPSRTRTEEQQQKLSRGRSGRREEGRRRGPLPSGPKPEKSDGNGEEAADVCLPHINRTDLSAPTAAGEPAPVAKEQKSVSAQISFPRYSFLCCRRHRRS